MTRPGDTPKDSRSRLEAFVFGADRVVDILCRIAAGLAVALLVAIFLVLIAELVSRNLLGRSLAGSWELAAFLMGAMFFLGLAPALRAGTHVRVTMLAKALSAPLARVAEAAATTIGLAASAFGTFALGSLAATSLSRGTKTWELALPLGVPQLALAAGMALLTLALAMRLVSILVLGTPDGTAGSAAPAAGAGGE
ncbi:MAG: hypothetical protein AcusKO_44310 [Acuticoccus sp.]